MHPADLEVWRAIDRGEREVDWFAWFGQPDGADYLTDHGKRLAQRAAAELTSFFGHRWLPRAVDPSSDRRIGGLGAASPVLALTPGDRAGAYAESIRWWASLQFLRQPAGARRWGYPPNRPDRCHHRSARTHTHPGPPRSDRRLPGCPRRPRARHRARPG